MTLQLKTCTVADIPVLREIGIETFTDTFGAQNKPENLNDYLKKAYDPAKLQSELETTDSYFYFLLDGEEIAGYVKLNINDAQTEVIADQALEIEKIYIRKNHKRKGFGRFLIEKAEELARKKRKSVLWLGVWEENHPAMRFYEKMGFKQTGESHSFFMRDDEQTDWIMAKQLD